jgi:hypothetical protein
MGNKTSALAEEVAHIHTEGEEEGLNTRLISIFIFLLVLFTLAAETGLDALHEALGEASSVGNQILSKVKNEVMLVGVLSLGLTLAEGVWDLPEEAVESFEWAHTLLFVAALVLVGFAASLIEACARISARYHATEGISLTSLIRRNDKYLKKGGDATKSCDDVIVVSRTTVSWSEAAHYAALRQDFFNRIDLPMAFDFSLYLDGALREFIVELMEVGVASWAAVLLVVALNEARIVVFDIESLAARVGLDVGESDVFLAAGWLLVAWSASLRGRLEQAWTQLLKNISCATPTCLGGKLRKARTARLLAGGERKREEKLEATIEKRERRRSEVPTANELQYEEEVETLEKDDEDDPLGVHKQEEEAELRTIRRSASVTRDVVAKLLHEGAAPPAADAVGTPAFRDVFPRDSPRFFSALVGALMLLNCFYGALLVMRYGKLAYAFEAGGTCAAGVVGGSSAARAAYVLATVAPIPLVLSAIRKLVATGSFIASLAHESEELVDEVLEESLKREHDVHAVRVAFRLAFETAGGASVDDLRKVFDTFDVDKDGEISKEEAGKLVRWIHGHRLPREHFDRIWRELNSDEVGGVDFGEFTTFVDPAFHRPLPKSVDCGPKLDLGAATPAKSPPKRHDSLFGALPSMAGLFPAEEDDAAAS